ncbi:MAG: DUF362 domain-containing protein [bacterium]|nr:MAG: DUF362 domain-containing protein [bacterium]
MGEVITRRDFLLGSTFAALGLAINLNAEEIQTKKSKVILIRHSRALDESYKFDEEVIQRMLDEAVMTLFNLKNPVKAFQNMVTPDDVVGIKSNVWTYLPTPPELERAIKKRLIEAGVREDNIGIDDRGVRENPIFQKSTALINVRPLRTHYLAGISGCMKNYITFAENLPDYHPNNCADLALLFKLPAVKGKTRLNILSALTPQFHGRGPHHFNRRYVWNYKGLIVGTDPVAVDAVGLQIIMAKRAEYFGKAQELPRVPRHIETADVKHGLGTSDMAKIDLIRLGWQEGILI